MTSTNAQDDRNCPHCGCMHVGRCPYVRAVEYYPDGSIKRVEYHETKLGDQINSLVARDVREGGAIRREIERTFGGNPRVLGRGQSTSGAASRDWKIENGLR